MADDKVALEIFIEADKAQMSLGDLEDGFESMQKRLRKVGRGSEEFKTLSTAMAQTTGEIKNIELGFEGLGKEEIASQLGSVAGGVGDVTASLVLMGGENETIEQMAASIETAMAISMGFKGAIEGGASAMKLYNNLIKTGKLQTILYSTATKIAAVATRVFNAILKANPIALLVTAIVAAGAALLVFAKNTSKAAKEAKMFNDIRKEAAKSIVSETTELKILLAVAKDETVAKEKRQEAIEELNRISPEYLSNLSLENVNTAEGTRLTDLYVESLIKASEAKAINAKIDAISTQILEEQNKEIQTGEALNALLTAAIWGESEARDNLNENRVDNIQALKDERKALMDKVVEMTKEGEVAIGVEGQKSNAEIEAEKVAARLAKEKEARDKAAQKLYEDGAEDRAMNRAKEKQAKKDALMEDIERVEIDRTMQTEELDRHSIHIEGLKSNEEILHDAKNFWHNKDLERIAEERAARLESAQANLQGAQQLVGSIAALNSAALDNDLKKAGNNEAKKEKLRKASFEREKKLNIAMALINGAQALTSIFAQYPKFDGGFAMVAALASSVITTAATIAKIKSTSYQGGGSPVIPETSTEPSAGGASTAAGGAAITPVSNTSTILGNQQVFVTETDITNTQNNVSVIEESATF